VVVSMRSRFATASTDPQRVLHATAAPVPAPEHRQLRAGREENGTRPAVSRRRTLGRLRTGLPARGRVEQARPRPTR
jgi:hypothetical protein